MDWLLFSWCLSSWIDQRPLLQQIFGAKMTTTSQGFENSFYSKPHNGKESHH
jgi:hypothetical protein